MKNLLLFFLFFSLFTENITSQEFPYTLNAYQEPYVALSEAIAVTPSDDPLWDDPEMGYYTIPIGFTFDLMGRSANELAIIDPGCQIVVAINGDTVNAISPYFADVMNADVKAVVSTILYTTEGPPGNQICKVEWKNVGFFEEFDATESFTSTSNYQVWIYESTNDIEFRYGPNTITDGTLIHQGWGSPLLFFIKDFIIQGQVTTTSWNLRGNPDDPTVDVVDLYTKPSLEDILLGEPTDSTVYHFGTGLVSINERSTAPKFSVFPTVTNQNVMTYWGDHDPATLRVFDDAGKLVLNRILSYGNSIIDVNTWSAGVYYFTLGEGPDMTTKRIIKK